MESTENRILRINGCITAPIELMWEVWTNPEHIAKWWGPDGFTCTIHKMELKEGGEWNLTLHGPDGTNYPNKSIFKEIMPSKKISFEHFNPHFSTAVIFEPKGSDTHVDWSMQFETEEMRGIVIKAHKADEGQKQNMERLKKYLSELGGKL